MKDVLVQEILQIRSQNNLKFECEYTTPNYADLTWDYQQVDDTGTNRLHWKYIYIYIHIYVDTSTMAENFHTNFLLFVRNSPTPPKICLLKYLRWSPAPWRWIPVIVRVSARSSWHSPAPCSTSSLPAAGAAWQSLCGSRGGPLMATVTARRQQWGAGLIYRYVRIQSIPECTVYNEQ